MVMHLAVAGEQPATGYTCLGHDGSIEWVSGPVLFASGLHHFQMTGVAYLETYLSAQILQNHIFAHCDTTNLEERSKFQQNHWRVKKQVFFDRLGPNLAQPSYISLVQPDNNVRV